MRIQEQFGIQMYEDEIGYISLHIVTNMDSQSAQKKQIAIINPDGAAISRFIGDMLRRYFNNSIEITGTYSLFQMDALKAQKPDLIVTTVPISQAFSCPVFQISSLLNSQELETIKQLLASQELGKLEARLGLLYQFDNRLFSRFCSLQKGRRLSAFFAVSWKNRATVTAIMWIMFWSVRPLPPPPLETMWQSPILWRWRPAKRNRSGHIEQ